MKGMFDFLERAGLVKRETPTEPLAPGAHDVVNTPSEPAVLAPPRSEPNTADGTGTVPLDLDTIYAGIAPAQYPAERLLRLVDGLCAMDQTTRLMAIQAMDAADESWTIADPLSDAAAKVTALAAYGESLKQKLQQHELQTQAQLDAVLARQEQVVGDIRKQITELEALVARELARSTQETSTHQAGLAAARDQTHRELGEIARVSERLQSLATQFGTIPSQ